jgi:hypothetical protein
MNGTSFVTAKDRQGFSLNGTDQAIVVDESPDFYPGINSFSIEAWVKSSNAASINMILTRYENGGVGPGGFNSVYLFSLNAGKLEGYLRDTDGGGPDGGGQTLTGHSLIADGAFHHVAMVRNMEAGQMSLYVDGYPEASATLSAGAIGPIKDDDGQSDPLIIGAQRNFRADDFSFFFSGVIDEPAYYNRALSPNEIAAIYAAGSAGKCKPQLVTPADLSGLALWQDAGTLSLSDGAKVSTWPAQRRLGLWSSPAQFVAPAYNAQRCH